MLRVSSVLAYLTYLVGRFDTVGYLLIVLDHCIHALMKLLPCMLTRAEIARKVG